MKKVCIIAAALLFVLFFTNTALAKYVHSHYEENTAMVGLTDVKIVSKSSAFNSSQEKKVEQIDAVSSVKENLENIKPGDNIALSYKIVNNGNIDVVLDGVNVTIHSDELKDKLSLKWRLIQYYDKQPINVIDSCANAFDCTHTSAFIDTSFADMTLFAKSMGKSYCMLCIELCFDDEDTTPFEIPAVTSFTISPSFRQK